MEVARADQEHPTIRRRRYEEIARADQEINSHEEAPRRGNRRCGRNTESGPLENGRVAVRDGSDLHLSQTLAVRCRPLDLADGAPSFQVRFAPLDMRGLRRSVRLWTVNAFLVAALEKATKIFLTASCPP